MPSKRVLLIEDDLTFQSIVSRFLTERGYKVLCADDGESGLEAVRNNPLDVVLCDLNLPGISGLEVLNQLLHSTVQLPVIVISASDKMADIREAVRLGAWDYIAKPVDPLESIETAIQDCLNRSYLENNWERERWELDDHIDVLFQNEHMVAQLAEDLSPHEPLRVGAFSIKHQVDDVDTQTTWVDYHRLPSNQAIVVMASSHALASQTLLSLLVLKTLFNPIIRGATSRHPDMLKNPHKILERLNMELCHSRIRTAFDMVLIWLDGDTGSVHWGHAGDTLGMTLESKPDLALGIWSHTNYHEHHGKVRSGDRLRIGNNSTFVNIMNRRAVSAA